MLWEDERYVRLYKRDTPDWLALSFDAQALFCLLLRKVDLSGRLELGRHGPKAVAAVINQVALWESRLRGALEELLADGCVQIGGETLRIPNYVAAQETPASPRLRKRLQREREGTTENPDVRMPSSGEEGQAVTEPRVRMPSRDSEDTNCDLSVTNGHAASRPVTPAKPSEPSVPSKPSDPTRSAPRARDVSNSHGDDEERDLWPADVFDRLRASLGVTDLDPAWQRFAGESAAFPVEARIAAAEHYIGERHPPGEHAPGYVLKIIERFAKTRARPAGMAAANASPVPKWKQQGASSPEEYESWLAEANRA